MFTVKSKENFQDYSCKFKHNQPVSLISLQANLLPNQRLYCKECIDQIEQDLKPIQGVLKIIEKPLKQRLKEYENELIPQLQQLTRISGTIYQLRKTIIQELDDFENRVNNFINRLKDIGKEMANYSFFDCLNSLIKNSGELDFEPIDLKKINEKWCSETISSLIKFEYYEEKNKIQIILNQLIGKKVMLVRQEDTKNKPEHTFQQLPRTIIGNKKPFSYEFKTKFQLNEKVKCYSLAINHDNSLFAIGQDDGIKIMEIQFYLQKQKQNVNQLAILREKGTQRVQNLVFFKKKTTMLNSLISTSEDQLITIWSKYTNFFNKTNWNPIFRVKYEYEIVRKAATSQIQFLQLNFAENEFFFSRSYSIYFYQFAKQSWTSEQQIQISSECITGLSINPVGNQLIVSSHWNITIYELINSIWILKQKIQIIGTGVCYINNFTFSFYQKQSQAVSLYSFDSNIKQYIKTSEIIYKGTIKKEEVSYYQIGIFVAFKNLLLSINGSAINILKFSFSSDFQNYECNLAQSIELRDGNLNGSISDNGEILIIYDPSLNEIQIREFQEQY
ncbi:unnamed protein product (macronuclear) [Paramecium tetraurelia]|uniref:Uncharacterized protein n=1 Tax=Paramecium tetraurelia TaxID=5888 RepID=A0BHU3_PARTE|nr:uncharacterized protein GSPATT00029146001 [Paramecium tetraurelia]CAK58110.1 unnamed protein product [Paramecium tetraurelia]|eukprot:XP_001425508.1 hypothetical protein (macronuclear) [Paramecium tetraurelia strain d4-2]